MEADLRRDYDLDGSRPDGRALLEPNLSFAAAYDPADWFRAFLSVEPKGLLDLAAGAEDRKRGRVEITEAFVLLREILDGRTYLKVGRQRFEDTREWLYDEQLDAVRVFYLFSGLAVEMAASRLDLVHRDVLHEHDTDPMTNLHGRLDYTFLETIDIAAYVLHRRHRSRSAESPLFLGLQSTGYVLDDSLQYWLELAHVRGRHGSADIRGYGVDLGGTYRARLPLSPSASIGFAFGTGDDDADDGTDHAFRQTGIQDNEAPIAGVANVRYYGELFDPELSNLAEVRVGIGLRPTETSSVDLVYHRYRQDLAVPSLRDSPLTAEPTGRGRDLGSEIDLVAGMEEALGFELKLAVGSFFPGRAFVRSRAALLLRIEAQYTFDSALERMLRDQSEDPEPAQAGNSSSPSSSPIR